MQQSAGTLLYRNSANGTEVLIVRPSGPAARYGWTIPKGIPEEGETLEQAARRETREETGCECNQLHYLGYCDYRKSRKRVHCFVGPAPQSEPSAASWEIDAARYFPLNEAKDRLHQDQRKFIDLLSAWMKLPTARTSSTSQ